MNAPQRVAKTTAETGFADLFANVRALLPGREGVAEARAAAFRAFEADGLPGRRVEEWKYTDLRALLREAKPLAGAPARSGMEAASAAGAVFDAAKPRRIVLLDGAFVPELSDLSALEPGLTIVSLGGLLTGGQPAEGQMPGALVPPQANAAIALNTAFMTDGVVIRIAKGSRIKRPIHLCFVHLGDATASFTRSLLLIEDRAAATFLESHEGPDAVEYQANMATELHIGEDCEVSLDRLQAEGRGALHLSTLMVDIGARANFSTTTVTTGAAVSRHQIFATLNGDHADAMIRGANLLNGKQHADTTILFDHAGPHGTSREVFKTVLADESRGVFQGKIIVRPQAQKTDGKMASHAVLLSELAEMDNKPELEIFADDVQCGHGATAGALDEELLFYLKARGIPKKEAEALLIQSFVGEAIEGVRNDHVRDALLGVVSDWLLRRG